MIVLSRLVSTMHCIHFVDIFEPFLKAYVEEYKFKSVSTDDWKQFLYKFFDDKVVSVIFTYWWKE